MSFPQTADVVVIGGGIIGTSIAFHLACMGVGKVVVLEREVSGGRRYRPELRAGTATRRQSVGRPDGFQEHGDVPVL